jgi:hypothetical protein
MYKVVRKYFAENKEYENWELGPNEMMMVFI